MTKENIKKVHFHIYRQEKYQETYFRRECITIIQTIIIGIKIRSNSFLKNFFLFLTSLGIGLERYQKIDNKYDRIKVIPNIAPISGEDFATISD